MNVINRIWYDKPPEMPAVRNVRLAAALEKLKSTRRFRTKIGIVPQEPVTEHVARTHATLQDIPEQIKQLLGHWHAFILRVTLVHDVGEAGNEYDVPAMIKHGKDDARELRVAKQLLGPADYWLVKQYGIAEAYYKGEGKPAPTTPYILPVVFAEKADGSLFYWHHYVVWLRNNTPKSDEPELFKFTLRHMKKMLDVINDKSMPKAITVLLAYMLRQQLATFIEIWKESNVPAAAVETYAAIVRIRADLRE